MQCMHCRNWNCWHTRRMQKSGHHSLQYSQVIQSRHQAVTMRHVTCILSVCNMKYVMICMSHWLDIIFSTCLYCNCDSGFRYVLARACMCILPVFLYGSDCWAISKTDTRKINALNLRQHLWTSIDVQCLIDVVWANSLLHVIQRHHLRHQKVGCRTERNWMRFNDRSRRRRRRSGFTSAGRCLYARIKQ